MSDHKKILSIDFDDSNDGYDEFSKYLNDDTHRKKEKTAIQIEELGELCIGEIERKNKQKTEKSKKLIPYILKKCNGKYTEEELLSYSHEDVKDIYNEVKEENKPTIVKFFQFLFNM